ncbi:sugar ABC transporter permease [Mycetocola lacteus]|uniref:Sugar ABC transporter permease n=1 Tax=Mycetocola lacteus TaxID=76637 RepID=A0A3L7AUF1_9MICO|nr:sugar ABC transporter permease [Mycetocola lacteus]RLP83181.1 sugar ABC transporter permease [Mycetocola lacteus]
MTSTLSGRGANTRPARPARRRGAAVGLLFIAPAFIGLLALYLIPLVRTVVLSLMETGPFGGGKFTGLSNYEALLGDEAFWHALRNSAIYTAIVLIGIPLAILVSALINNARRGRAIYRVLYFLPVVTLPVAVGMVWRYIYNGDFGLLNQFLALFGIDGPSWVADPQVAIFAVAIVGIWMTLGTNIIILGAGMQGIPEELMEASSLDGAGPVRQFFGITLPLLSPSIFFVSVLSVISSLQMFDLIYVMIGRGSPALDGSKTIVFLFYQKAFIENDQGFGAAIAIVLLMIIMAATAIQFRLQRRWVFYG